MEFHAGCRVSGTVVNSVTANFIEHQLDVGDPFLREPESLGEFPDKDPNRLYIKNGARDLKVNACLRHVINLRCLKRGECAALGFVDFYDTGGTDKIKGAG